MQKERKIEYLEEFKTAIDNWFELHRHGKHGESEAVEPELARLWGGASEILKGLGYKTEIEITNERGTKIGSGDIFTDGFFSTHRTSERTSNLFKIQASTIGAIEKLKLGEMVRENILPDVNAVLNILRSFPDVVSRFKFRRKGKTLLEVTDEYDVQDIIYAMLKGMFPTLQYEDPTTKVGPNSGRADFTISDLGVFIEVKYISEKGKEKSVHDECLADIQKYATQESCQKIIFFVYDPEKCIDNQYGFRNGLGNKHIRDGKEVEVISVISN